MGLPYDDAGQFCRRQRNTISQGALEERMSRVEQLLDQLLQSKRPTSEQPGRDDWQQTFGMFAGDPVMKEIIDAGQRIREEDRRQVTP